MLVIAVAVTVLAVGLTGWRSLCDLEQIEQRVGAEPGPVAPRPMLRLVDPSRLTAG